MLCGASQILGLYVIASPENLTKYKTSYETILKALLLDRTTTAISSSTFFLLSISLSTGALSTQRCTFTEKNPSSVTDSVQFRIANSKASDLVGVRTTWKLDLLLPVKRTIAGEHEQRFHKTLLKVLSDECSKIESSIVIDVSDDTIVEDDDEEELVSTLGETCLKLPSSITKLSDIESEIDEAINKASTSSRKKSKKVVTEEKEPEMQKEEKRFALFSRPMAPTEVNSFVVHQVASGALRLRGTIVGVSWLPAAEMKTKSSDANEAKMARFIRLDLMRSLQSRVGHLFDDIASRNQSMDANEDDADKTSLGRAKTFLAELPRRVLLVQPKFQQSSFCDYLSSNESLEDCKERIASSIGINSAEIELEELEIDNGALNGGKSGSGGPWSESELADMPNDSVSSSTNHRNSSGSGSASNGASVPSLVRSMLILILVALLGLIVAYLAVDPAAPKTVVSRVSRTSSAAPQP